MLDQYTNLKNKLEISLLSNSKLHEELKSQQKLIEEFKKDYSLSYKTIKDLSSQVSLLLFFSEKMRTKIHELSPYFDLSIYLDYKKPLEKINLDEQEQFYFLTIQDLQENNRNLLEKLNKIHLNEGFQINPIEFEELKHKNANIQLEIKQKQNLIDSLQEKIKKMQTLEDVKQLILGKNSEPFLNLEKKDLSNRNSLEKNSRIYDKHAKLIEENASLRKEEKRLKIDLKKLTFSHENLNNLNENLQDKIEQYIHSLNSLKETLSIKENEINSVIKEKNLIAETLTQRNNEIDALKLKVLELEKQCLFYDESKKSIEDLLNKALNEKMKYFDGFMSGQKEISSLMMRHKSELLFSREENQRILTEKQKNNEFFIQKSNEYKINQMKYKAKIENQELLLLQLNKKNQLNSQIISEQNQQILELNRKINIPINPFSFEEGVHSGFIHISQQKSYNLEDLKETLEHQKNSYESLIEKMTEKLMLLEQENLAYQDNVKNLESANEDLQEKLESTLQKIQEMEIEAENPQISNEEIELLNQEKANLKIENDELKKKLNDIVIEKDELKVTETQYLDKIKELTEENLILLQEIKDIKRKYEYQANVTHLKDILIKEQYELFKCQMKENSKQNEEKNKEIDSLLEKLQRKEEDEKEIDKMELEIEENVRELKEDDILLQLREKIGMLELKLQEKINEEFVFKTQANQYRTQLEVKVQEVLFGKQKEVYFYYFFKKIIIFY